MSQQRKIILVFGRTGSGKSYLVKKMIQNYSRAVIFDIMSEYNSGFVFQSENIKDLQQFWLKVYKGKFRITFRPLMPEIEIRKIAGLVYALGDIAFVVEEIDSICTPYEIPDYMQQIIQRGRHKNITLIGISPAPYGIHRNLTRQAKEIYIFKTIEPRDINYLKELLGAEIEGKIAAIEQYQYVKWSDDKPMEIGKA